MTASARIEHQLLFASSQALHQIDQWDSSSLSEAQIDWQYIYSQAIQHRTVPLLQYFLKTHSEYQVPEKITTAIDQYVHRQALANIFQTNELLGILTRFKTEHIDAIPFKGPVLGMHLYGQLSYRAFGDLDILIHRENFFKVKEILIEMGYLPFRNLSKKEEAAFLDTQMGYEFVRKDERCVIEIHWSLLSRVHAFNIPDDELWSSKKTLEIQNKLLPTLDDKHLFIYLCAHGTKSFWARLRWISDIAEMIYLQSKGPEASSWWSSVLQLADSYNSVRMVHLGIYLAHQLLNAPVPKEILKAASEDKNVQFLFNRVLSALFVPPEKKKSVLKPISFHLSMRERFKDKKPYLSHVFKLWFFPSKKDEAFLKLPTQLSFLYVLVKPFRIASRVLSKKAR